MIQICHSLAENIGDKKQTITNQFDGTPWLEDMIQKANEVLNALLRLRKHQMTIENARKFYNTSLMRQQVSKV